MVLKTLFAVLLLAFTTGSLTMRAPAQLPPGAQDSTSPQRAPDLRAEANEALEKQDYPRALKVLTQLAGQNPQDAQLLYDLAYTQEALDQTSAAEASYRAAIAADAVLLEPHLGLGLLLARTGHAAEAHGELVVAAHATSGASALKARAYRALARLDLKGSPDVARDELLEALKLSPETPDDALMAAELAEGSKDPAAAEQAYRRTLVANPNEPRATAALAHLIGATQPHEAEALLVAALSAHPQDPSLTAELATLYAAQNRPGDAVALVETLHTADPRDANITRLLGHLYVQAGVPEKADPLFAELLAAHPDAGLMDDRADTLIKLHRYAEAETLLAQAIRDPAAFASREDFGMAASHLAFAASNNDDPATVLRALGLRATVLPQSPSALFLAAAAHDRLHEFKQAADLYQQFLAAAHGKYPDEEFEARHRLIALQKRN